MMATWREIANRLAHCMPASGALRLPPRPRSRRPRAVDPTDERARVNAAIAATVWMPNASARIVPAQLDGPRPTDSIA